MVVDDTLYARQSTLVDSFSHYSTLLVIRTVKSSSPTPPNSSPPAKSVISVAYVYIILYNHIFKGAAAGEIVPL